MGATCSRCEQDADDKKGGLIKPNGDKLPRVNIDVIHFEEHSRVDSDYIIVKRRSEMDHKDVIRIKVDGPASIYIGASIAIAGLDATNELDIKENVPYEREDRDNNDVTDGRKMSVMLGMNDIPVI